MLIDACCAGERMRGYLFLHCEFTSFIEKYFLKVCGISWHWHGWGLTVGSLLWVCLVGAEMYSFCNSLAYLVIFYLSKWLLCKIDIFKYEARWDSLGLEGLHNVWSIKGEDCKFLEASHWFLRPTWLIHLKWIEVRCHFKRRAKKRDHI